MNLRACILKLFLKSRAEAQAWSLSIVVFEDIGTTKKANIVLSNAFLSSLKSRAEASRYIKFR